MNKVSKQFVFYGAIFMALAIILGAFGAHGLKNILSKEMLSIYHTGVEYQFYNALGLFVIAFVANFNDKKQVKLAGYFMMFGIIVFCGSLYILSITGLKWIGAITPIGGAAFIIAWIMMASSVKGKKSDI